MNERAAELARRFEQIHDELLGLLESADDEQWCAMCPGEEWPLGALAQHLADYVPFQIALLRQVASGETPDSRTLDMVNEQNARYIGLAPAKEQTLTALHDTRRQAVEAVRAFSDDELQRNARVPLIQNREVTLDWLIKGLLIGHYKMHLPGIQAVLRRDAAVARSGQ